MFGGSILLPTFAEVETTKKIGIMTLIKNLTIENISQIYRGKDAACRCGCKGNYFASTSMLNPRSKVDDKKVQSLLDKAIKFEIEGGSKIEYGSSFINVSYGNNKAITIYLDELKTLNQK